jgi:hypothetical protein
VMQDPRVVGKKFGSFPSNFFTQPSQFFQIVNLVDNTKALVQCCHGKHTVVSSRTLL